MRGMHRLPTTIEMLRDLVRAPSVSSIDPSVDSGNRAVVDLLGEWARSIGMSVELLPLPDAPGKWNMIATLGSGGDGLVLAGHTDTVPYDAHRWRYDPFKLTQVAGRMYGLGTTDMKGFFPLVLEAISRIDARRLRAPVTLLATADEESGMGGARALAASGRAIGRYAIIGEPTSLRPVRMHKGMMMEAVRLEGRSGHSSNPDLGVNALEGMYIAMGEILKWREELQARYRNPLFQVPVPTLNLGRIHGGDNPNRICANCELHIDIRPLPGMTVEELRHTLHQRLSQALKHHTLSLSITPLFHGIEAMETPVASALVQATEQLTGHTAGSAAFGTEGPYLQRLGMDTIILGPGHIDQAHKPDEYLALNTLQPTLDLLRGLIRRFCL